MFVPMWLIVVVVLVVICLIRGYKQAYAVQDKLNSQIDALKEEKLLSGIDCSDHEKHIAMLESQIERYEAILDSVEFCINSYDYETQEHDPLCHEPKECLESTIKILRKSCHENGYKIQSLEDYKFSLNFE